MMPPLPPHFAWLSRQRLRLKAGRRALGLLHRQHGSWLALLAICGQRWHTERLPGIKRLLLAALQPPADHLQPAPHHATPASPYDRWISAQHHRIAQLQQQLPQLLSCMNSLPRFSLVVPVFNTDPVMLEKMIASVSRQLYPHWELCLADDASSAPHIRPLLNALSAAEPRIRIAWRTQNGHISEATNSAISIASGDYVAFLDHDDELAPHALLSFAQWINQHPDSELIYSDEDKLDEHDRRVYPYFKPDWSPMLLCSQNYLGHQVCVKRSLLQRAGPFRSVMNGSQDYDMVLRLSALAQRIDHLPDVLYHWRLHAGSTAINTEAKPYAHEAGRLAISDHLQARYGAQFIAVDEGEHLFTYVPRFKAPATRVSLIIAADNDAARLQRCIHAIRSTTDWRDYEILIIGAPPARAEPDNPAVRWLPPPADSNLAERNNLGARQATGDVLLFLSDRSQPLNPDWLARLLEVACLPDVATVAPRRILPDGSLHYAGAVITSNLSDLNERTVSPSGTADQPQVRQAARPAQTVRLYAGSQPSHPPGPFISSVLTRNVLANPADSLMIERSKFEQLGGFDTRAQDDGAVRLGAKAHRLGWQNIYLASVTLRHHGGAPASAGQATPSDPFYNPNLSIHSSAPEPTA